MGPQRYDFTLLRRSTSAMMLIASFWFANTNADDEIPSPRQGPTTQRISTTQIIIRSAGDELSYLDVINAFVGATSMLPLPAKESEDVQAWIRVVLSHPHRPINKDSVAAFQSSLNDFPKNIGWNLPGNSDNNNIDVLKMCISFAWAKPEVDQISLEAALSTYTKLNSNLMEQARKEIVKNLPDDKREQWQKQIEDSLNSTESRLNENMKYWVHDFLLPAYKQPPTDEQSAVALKDLLGLVPQYGKDPSHFSNFPGKWDADRLFSTYLGGFNQAFLNAYGSNVTFLALRKQMRGDTHWSKYLISCSGSDGPWPIRNIILELSKDN